MSDDAKVNMMLYPDVLPEEETVLKRMEDDVLKFLLTKSIIARPMWTAGSAESGERVLKLTLPLLVLPSGELATLSADKLVSRLNENFK